MYLMFPEGSPPRSRNVGPNVFFDLGIIWWWLVRLVAVLCNDSTRRGIVLRERILLL